jgi:hypothetical protein
MCEESGVDGIRTGYPIFLMAEISKLMLSSIAANRFRRKRMSWLSITVDSWMERLGDVRSRFVCSVVSLNLCLIGVASRTVAVKY